MSGTTATTLAETPRAKKIVGMFFCWNENGNVACSMFGFRAKYRAIKFIKRSNFD